MWQFKKDDGDDDDKEKVNVIPSSMCLLLSLTSSSVHYCLTAYPLESFFAWSSTPFLTLEEPKFSALLGLPLGLFGISTTSTCLWPDPVIGPWFVC